MAIWGLINYAADPVETWVPVISTNLGDAERRVWGHIVTYHGEAAIPLPGEVIQSLHKIALKDDAGRRTGSAVSEISLVAAGDNTNQALKKLQGSKNKRIILLCDEMQDVSPSIEKAIWNLIKNPYFEFRGVGNPAETFDFHGRLSEPIESLGGHSLDYENLESWPVHHNRMGSGVCIHFNSADSPNFEREAEGLPLLDYLPMPDDVRAVRAMPKARELMEVWRQEIGVWAKGVNLKQTVFTDEETHRFGIRDIPVNVLSSRLGMGIDPAWVDDGDDYVITIFKLCSTVESGGVFQLVEQRILKGETYADPITGTIHRGSHARAWETRRIADNYGIAGQCVGVDATGALHYADTLDIIFGQSVLRVGFGESASNDLAVSLHDERVGKDAYDNKATEMWQQAHSFAEHGQLKGISDPAILKELTGRRYNLTKRGKQSIESKAKFKERTGGKSPDRADSLVIGLEVARQRMGAIAGQKVIQTRVSDWNRQVQHARVPVPRLQGGGGLTRLSR
jgi:hypothetical protein